MTKGDVVSTTNDVDAVVSYKKEAEQGDLPFQSYELIGNINKAKQICPLVTLIQTEDGLASHILEND